VAYLLRVEAHLLRMEACLLRVINLFTLWLIDSAVVL
jgi:hypothetical protein